ncbi:hypothetical protein TNCV_1248891 [Trichonephila clavipes]|nr:hypothetical protein TNCV_1248891 [Trichonephila clavipes]
MQSGFMTVKSEVAVGRPSVIKEKGRREFSRLYSLVVIEGHPFSEGQKRRIIGTIERSQTQMKIPQDLNIPQCHIKSLEPLFEHNQLTDRVVKGDQEQQLHPKTTSCHCWLEEIAKRLEEI